MNITLKFKSRITTEETYPHSFEVTFARELRIPFDSYKDENELYDIIFKDAHEFEETILKGQHLVSMTTECLGITFVHDAKSSELLDFARLGIERV